MRSLVPLLIVLGACGGGEIEVVGGIGSTRGRSQVPQVEDQRIVMESTEIVGNATAPAALGGPPMPSPATAIRLSLASARARADRSTRSELDVMRVVSLLWDEADRAEISNPDQALELRGEARDRLEEWVADRNERDPFILEMLAAASAGVGDTKRATALYGQLARLAKGEKRDRLLTWKAWLQLRNRAPLKALETLREVNITTAPAEAAYTMGWAAFLRGDDDGARLGLITALDRWERDESRATVEAELLRIFAQTGTTVDKLIEALTLVAGDDAKRRYELAFASSERYRDAGYYQHAAAALSYALKDALADGQVPPEDVVGFHFRRADYAFRADAAEDAAEAAIRAHKALAECGEPCDADTHERVLARIMRLAQFYHTSHTASLDDRHYRAARKLYDYYLSLEGTPDAVQTKTLRANLEDSKANANPANGRHDEGIMATLGQSRREVLVACYERVLTTDPAVSGPLKLVFEVDQSGHVVGSSSEPAPGLEGTAAVAECMTRRVRTWRFPSRTVPGTTVVELAIQLTSQ